MEKDHRNRKSRKSLKASDNTWNKRNPQSTSRRQSSICCVLSPVPSMMHLIPSMSPMPSLVSCLLVWHSSLFSFPCFLFLSCLSLLFLSCLLSFPISFFRFLVSSFLFFIFFSCFFFFPIDLRLSCVCVVIRITCNMYVVTFFGWQVSRFFQARVVRRMHQYGPGTS